MNSRGGVFRPDEQDVCMYCREGRLYRGMVMMPNECCAIYFFTEDGAEHQRWQDAGDEFILYYEVATGRFTERKEGHEPIVPKRLRKPRPKPWERWGVPFYELSRFSRVKDVTLPELRKMRGMREKAIRKIADVFRQHGHPLLAKQLRDEREIELFRLRIRLEKLTAKIAKLEDENRAIIDLDGEAASSAPDRSPAR